MPKRTTRNWTWPLLVAWGGLVVSGFAFLEKYQNTPGASARPPIQTRQIGPKPHLWVFLHPQCGCSHATVAELARLAFDSSSKLDIDVEVFQPHSQSLRWAEDGLFKEAKAIPGVSVHLDPDGKAARSFGVFTSGQALLYSGDGKLEFSGGLTASRGHEGDNAGIDAVNEFVATGKSSVHSTPVFGCALGIQEAGA